MKRLFTLVLALAPMLAHAGVEAQIAAMASKCREQMDAGVCFVENMAPLPESVRAVPMRLGAALGTVTTGAFIDVQSHGKQMCDFITEACTSNWDGEHCRVIRSFWFAP